MRRLVFCLLALWPAAGSAQSGSQSAGAWTREQPSILEPTLTAVPAPTALQTPAGAFAASLVLPGAGQAALGLRRWLVYGALEAAFWTVHLDAAADFRRLRTAYRDLAWDVARSPTGPTAREEGPWEYYEHMSHYLASGAFDRDPTAPGIQPEQDLSTYNGTIWDLARGLYLPPGPVDPGSSDYQAALAYYGDHAAGPDFLWSWIGQADALGRFRGLIRDADDEARLRSNALGLVLANHLVSAVDAFVVARLRGARDVSLESGLDSTDGTVRWNVGLKISLPNQK